MKCNAVASNPLTSQLPFGGDVGKHAMLVRTGGGRWRATRLPPAEVNHARPPKQNQNKTKTKQNKTKQNKTKRNKKINDGRNASYNFHIRDDPTMTRLL